jgi:hypothetical protein
MRDFTLAGSEECESFLPVNLESTGTVFLLYRISLQETESGKSGGKSSSSGLQALISKFQTKEEALKSNETWVKPVDLDLYCNQATAHSLYLKSDISSTGTVSGKYNI